MNFSKFNFEDTFNLKQDLDLCFNNLKEANYKNGDDKLSICDTSDQMSISSKDFSEIFELSKLSNQKKNNILTKREFSLCELPKRLNPCKRVKTSLSQRRPKIKNKICNVKIQKRVRKGKKSRKKRLKNKTESFKRIEHHLNRTEKKGAAVWKKIQFFKNIETFLVEMFMNDRFRVDLLEEMDPRQKKFLFSYLRAIIGVWVDTDTLSSFRSMSEFYQRNKRMNRKFKKRNEEKLKFVYKLFIKEVEKEFRGLSEKEQCKYESIYKYLFKELICKNQKFEKIVNEVCFEININNKEIRQRKKIQKFGKFYKMKKISASFRYLVSLDENSKLKFLNFLNTNSLNSYLSIVKRLNEDKIIKIVKNWTKTFSNLEENFDKLYLYFNSKFNSIKFKSPWFLKFVEDAKFFCIYDLDSLDPYKEFTKKYGEFDLI